MNTKGLRTDDTTRSLQDIENDYLELKAAIEQVHKDLEEQKRKQQFQELTDERIIEIIQVYEETGEMQYGTTLIIGCIERQGTATSWKRRHYSENIIRAVIEHYNDGWKPDWNRQEQNKIEYGYAHRLNKVCFNSVSMKYSANYMYIGDQEDARSVINFCSNFHGINLWHWYFEITE